MSNRNNWKFKYSGSSLAMAAGECKEYHEKRLEFWQNELTIAEDTLKNSTVTFHEYQGTVVAGQQNKSIQPMIDPTLQQRFAVCQGKVNEHAQKIEDFDRWRRGFEHNDQETFELDPEDISYFHL